jgi:hypothetical protein
VLAEIEKYDEPCPLTAREVAMRALILQGVVAAAGKVNPIPIVEWFQEQKIWDAASPTERRFLTDPSIHSAKDITRFRWRQEAEWTLLWIVGKVEILGLPTNECDTRRLIDEIIPALGSDIEDFLSSAKLRSPGELLAESDRHYNLWCRYIQDRKITPSILPSDLLPDVLFQREYVFEWMFGVEAWDDVSCDS